jgi:uncharacterized protein YjiS (DUF1127 family)
MIKNLMGYLKARQAKRQALFELESLTDRELADIGITRSDLPFIVSEMHND